MSRRGVGLRGPVAPAPIDRVGRRLRRQALPPHVAVIRLGAVGEDRVAADRVDRVRVRDRARARGDAEEARLGVDRVQLAILAELHPGDVVADRLDLPVGKRRDQHREVRLAARARERRRDVLDLALRRGQLEDEHVLGEPPLVARHHGRDPKREALLAEQRVATVAGAVRPDLTRLREVHDVLVLSVARPRDVLVAVGERHADRMQARHELAVLAEAVERRLAHPGHDPHRAGHVRRVGQLHTDVGDRGPERTHAERNDVHRPAPHRALEQPRERNPHFLRVTPVVGWPGVICALWSR